MRHTHTPETAADNSASFDSCWDSCLRGFGSRMGSTASSSSSSSLEGSGRQRRRKRHALQDAEVSVFCFFMLTAGHVAVILNQKKNKTKRSMTFQHEMCAQEKMFLFALCFVEVVVVVVVVVEAGRV